MPIVCARPRLFGYTFPSPPSGYYQTNFDATENPLSETGRWIQAGSVVGPLLTNIRSSGGVAFGTQVGDGTFDDSAALIDGTWSAAQRVTAIIEGPGSQSGGTSSHEIRLILRGNFGPGVWTWYGAAIGYNDQVGTFDVQVWRIVDDWFGPDCLNVGNFVNAITSMSSGDTVVFQIAANGDILLTHNGLTIQNGNDTFIASGKPGISTFWRGTEQQSDFGFRSLVATNI